MVFEFKFTNDKLRNRILNSQLIDNLKDKKLIKQKLVQSLLDELGLTKSANTLIQYCSGGEKKRLSLAIELIALPDILILDEPTTGLDSSTSLQLINYLEKFTQTRNLTVIAVIHQPSFNLFNKFGNVIIQDKKGQNIFNGPPSKLITYLREFDLNCPKYYNPAEFILDVANGDFGETILENLADFQRKRHEFIIERESFKNSNKLSADSKLKMDNILVPNDTFVPLTRVLIKSCPFYFKHLFLLTYEAAKVQLTDKLVLKLKSVVYLMNLIAFHMAFGLENGKYDGCPNYELTKRFEPSKLSDILKYNKDSTDGLMGVTGNIYFSVFIACYATAVLPAIKIPNELKVLLKQLNNLWYSLFAYYFSRFLADLPIHSFFVILYATLNWLLTGIVASFDRYVLLIICYIALTIFIQSLAYLVGAIFIDSANASAYLILLGSIPMVMVCERINLSINTDSILIWAFSGFAFMKYEFRAMVLALYGNSRCDETFKDLFINYTLEMKEWFDFNLDVKKAGDATNYTGSGVTEKFTNNLVKLINGEYFNKNNPNDTFEFRSLIMNKLEFGDFNYTNQLLILLLESVIARILSIVIIYYITRTRTF